MRITIRSFALTGVAANAAFPSLPQQAASKLSSKYRRLTHPTLVPLNKLFSNAFPLSITESWSDYRHRNLPLQTQHQLLSVLPFYPQPNTSKKHGKVVQTEVSKGTINEFVIYPPGKTSADDTLLNHLIMVHGYGAGLGFFLKNFDEISQTNNWVIHAIDLLGYGCSSRPKFTSDNLAEVEGWFHDSFDEWLEKRSLKLLSQQTMVMAHSMGAYLMATYGIKRNTTFCKKLLMVSPGAVIKHRQPVFVPKYFARLWEQNISPFTIVRKAGPLGSKLVSGWSLRRFAKLSPTEQEWLHRYSYAIFQQPGLGEYMLNYLLAPGADARHPLISRGIHKLKCQVDWWYGKEDWMDVHGGRLCANILNATGGKSTVTEIDDAGHHLYLDNTEVFNAMMVEEMKKMTT